MITDGDKVAVGVSGGKDSMTLLTALAKLRGYYPLNFELEAVTLTLGIGEFDTSPISQYCAALDVPYTVEETLIGKIVFEVRKEKNPCSMCANLRRGALNETALRLDCNKVALAHSCDDLIETFLLSTLYEGRLHTFSPVTHLKRTNLDLIRPLSYVWEKDVKGFINKYKIITVTNPCTAAGHSTRNSVKDMLAALTKENKKVKYNILGAIKRAGIDGWRET
jgi:tRNA(Ile)-lysidine synthase TilS/MesJ